jgi:hypothetical protein
MHTNKNYACVHTAYDSDQRDDGSFSAAAAVVMASANQTNKRAGHLDREQLAGRGRRDDNGAASRVMPS